MSEIAPAADVRHPVRVVMAAAAAFVSGMLVAVQSRINGQLGLVLGDGFVAAFLSFGSGLVILAIAMMFWGRGRRGVRRIAAAVRQRRIPWWYLVGGTAGAFFVLSQGLVVGLVGVALFTVGVVAGQMTSSLVIDRRGFGTMAPKRLTLTRIVGAALALVGVTLAVSSEFRTEVPFWLLVAPFIAGIGVGYQQAANGQVRAVADSALTATFGNFVVGTLVLGIALLAHLAFAPWPAEFPASPWLYLGGVVGVTFIGMQVVIVRTTGVLLLGLAILSGQLATAVMFDVVLPVPGHQFTVLGLVGALITLVAVGVAVIPMRRPAGQQVRASSGSPSR